MTKRELFDKYNVSEIHAQWDPKFDTWTALDLYMVMHHGNLPQGDDMEEGDFTYILDFLDAVDSGFDFSKDLLLADIGCLYITAKRLIYKLSDKICNS